MWPKMLLELLPHLARLVPMADRFFQTRSASEKAQEAAMVALADGVRGDLGQVTAAHGALYRQVQEQGAALSAEIAVAALEAKAARAAAESIEARITKLEVGLKSAVLLGQVALSLLVAALVLLGLLLARTR